MHEYFRRKVNLFSVLRSKSITPAKASYFQAGLKQVRNSHPKFTANQIQNSSTIAEILEKPGHSSLQVQLSTRIVLLSGWSYLKSIQETTQEKMVYCTSRGTDTTHYGSRHEYTYAKLYCIKNIQAATFSFVLMLLEVSARVEMNCSVKLFETVHVQAPPVMESSPQVQMWAGSWCSSDSLSPRAGCFQWGHSKHSQCWFLYPYT